jgi:hypothetical protein
VTIASGVLNLLNPVGGTNTGADIYRLISVNQLVGSNFRLVTEVNRSEHNLIINHSESVLYPTTSRPVYYRQTETNLNIIPAPSDGTIIAISYYKIPVAPKWAYVVVNEKALYNSNLSTDFELHISEEENLVLRILMLAGLTIQRPDVVQAGGQGIQMINQEQNS